MSHLTIFKHALCICCLCWSSPLVGQQRETVIVFVNGINTDRDGAVRGKDLIEGGWREYASKHNIASPVTFEMSYNESYGSLADLIEAEKQFAGQGGSTLSRYFYNRNLFATASDSDQKFLAATLANTPASQFNQQMLTTDNTSATTALTLYDPLDNALKRLAQPDFTDLTFLVNKLEMIIDDGKRAVCMGHSQGNFYCNLAYQMIQLDYDGKHTLRTRGADLPNDNILSVVQVATPASFTADGRQQYVSYCRDFVNSIPDSLNANYKNTKELAPCMPRANAGFFSDLTDWLPITVNGAGIKEHYLDHYLDPSSGTYEMIMAAIANSLPDVACGRDDNCFMWDAFRGTPPSSNWTIVKFPRAITPGPSGLVVATAMGDPSSLRFDEGGGLATKRVFAGRFFADLSFSHIGGGISKVSLIRTSDQSTLLSITVDDSPGRDEISVYPASTAVLPTASGFSGWHQIAFSKKDTRLVLYIDGRSIAMNDCRLMDGLYISIYSIGNNKLAVSDFSVSRVPVYVTSSVGVSPSGPYAVGQSINGGFTIQNYSSRPVTLSRVVLAGRLGGQCPSGQCPDFPAVDNITLESKQTDKKAYSYRGTKQLLQPGHYDFFVAYIPQDSSAWDVDVLAAAGRSASLGIDVSVVAAPLNVTCSANPSSIKEGQSTSFTASASGGRLGYKYSWTGVVSGTSQSVSRTLFAAGTYQAHVTVTDTSNPPQAQAANCGVEVRSAAPVPSAPSISGYTLKSAAVPGQPISLDLSGDGFDAKSLQVWFYGLKICLAGCRHPAAGVTNVTARSASLQNVRLAQDTYRMKVRNGDTGSWSAASDAFQVSAASSQPSANLTENFNNAPDYSNNWVVAWQSSGTPTPTVTYTAGNFRIEAPNTCPGGWSPSNGGVSIGFRSKATFFGDLDLNTQLDHLGFGRTTIGLWSAGQWLVSTVLDTDDTNYLAFGGPGFATEWQHSGSPYMNRWISLRIQIAGSQVKFYADGQLLNAFPFTPPAVGYNVVFGAGSVCWKSGPNDTSFRRITATTGTSTTTPLSVACSVSPSSIALGQGATVYGSASGGTPPYQYQINGGALSSVSSLSVLPSASGTYIATIKTLDSQGVSASGSCSAQVTGPTSLTGSCLVNGQSSPLTLQAGNQATFSVNTAGGTNPLHFVWSGIASNDSNAASQIYSSAGAYDVSVVVSDSGEQRQQITLACPRVTVQSPPPISAYCSLNPNPTTLGSGTTLTAGAIGGTAPYQFLLPGNSSYTSGNSVVVMPTSPGNASYQITAKDSVGRATMSQCSVQVNLGDPFLTNSQAAPNPVRAGQVVTVQLWGGNFYTGQTQVSLIGPGCAAGLCLSSAVTVRSNAYLEAGAVLNRTGTYTVSLRNGSGTWVSVPGLSIAVNP